MSKYFTDIHDRTYYLEVGRRVYLDGKPDIGASLHADLSTSASTPKTASVSCNSPTPIILTPTSNKQQESITLFKGAAIFTLCLGTWVAFRSWAGFGLGYLLSSICFWLFAWRDIFNRVTCFSGELGNDFRRSSVFYSVVPAIVWPAITLIFIIKDFQLSRNETSDDSAQPILQETISHVTQLDSTDEALKCDVCGAKTRRKDGYALTTTQVTTSSRYWSFIFKGLPTSPESVMMRMKIPKEQASSQTPWLVCESCSGMFEFDRANAKECAVKNITPFGSGSADYDKVSSAATQGYLERER